jgi:DNA-binding response OmpR family regulator
VNRTVLIVDEHPQVASTLAAAVVRGGYQARTAHTFHEAMAFLQREEPAAIVVSVELGAFNGLHLLIRAGALYPSAKVVVVGPPSRGLEDEARALGAGAYLGRPCAPETVMSMVNALLFSAGPFIIPPHAQGASLR